MIRIENLTKSFGSNLLFEGLSLKINPRERIGLVGRNGHGKTTLLRILAGDEMRDEGVVSIPKHYRVGYVRQQLEFKEETILKECIAHLPEAEKENIWQVEKILAGLGFSNGDMERPPGHFSGGFQVRLNLAKVLVSEPDLLLLDEPTNYLDIMAIRWIESFLTTWPHELMLVTHDRSFMDKIVTHTAGIHRKKLRKIEGNTEKYYTQIALDEEVYEKTRINDERKRKEMELFISRFRAKARLANMVQSRVKTLAKLEKKDKLERLKNLDFSFKAKPYKGKYVMNINGLTFGYDAGAPLFADVSLTVKAGDRVCIVGRNGKGKTTLLKVLAGVLQPHKGSVSFNPGVEYGFFEQTNISRLDDDKSALEEILYTHPEVDQQAARNICGAMMFSGDDALKRIRVLSGGEKSRVMLGKLLVTPVNLLLLDEPTNHLDMESCDALLAAIDAFEGAVIMVTHNEMFLHAIANRLIVFQNDGAWVFEGRYQRFLEKDGWQEKGGFQELRTSGEEGDALERVSKKELRRRRSEIIMQRSKELKPLEKGIDKAERKIEQLEGELAGYNQAMQEATLSGDGQRIATLSQSIHTCENSIEKFFDELEMFTEQLETRSVVFKRQLEELERMGDG